MHKGAKECAIANNCYNCISRTIAITSEKEFEDLKKSLLNRFEIVQAPTVVCGLNKRKIGKMYLDEDLMFVPKWCQKKIVVNTPVNKTTPIVEPVTVVKPIPIIKQVLPAVIYLPSPIKLETQTNEGTVMNQQPTPTVSAEPVVSSEQNKPAEEHPVTFFTKVKNLFGFYQSKPVPEQPCCAEPSDTKTDYIGAVENIQQVMDLKNAATDQPIKQLKESITSNLHKSKRSTIQTKLSFPISLGDTIRYTLERTKRTRVGKVVCIVPPNKKPFDYLKQTLQISAASTCFDRSKKYPITTYIVSDVVSINKNNVTQYYRPYLKNIIEVVNPIQLDMLSSIKEAELKRESVKKEALATPIKKPWVPADITNPIMPVEPTQTPAKPIETITAHQYHGTTISIFRDIELPTQIREISINGIVVKATLVHTKHFGKETFNITIH